jgi:hypothetical protein
MIYANEGGRERAYHLAIGAILAAQLRTYLSFGPLNRGQRNDRRDEIQTHQTWVS